jgi:hypothetical protein
MPCVEGERRPRHRVRGAVQVRLFDSPTEELAWLEVREIIGGYYRQVGVAWDGGRRLAAL